MHMSEIFFRYCPRCHNADGGETIYRCVDCALWFCNKCKDISKPCFESRCPHCGSDDDHYEFAKIDTHKSPARSNSAPAVITERQDE